MKSPNECCGLHLPENSTRYIPGVEGGISDPGSPAYLQNVHVLWFLAKDQTSTFDNELEATICVHS